MSTTPTEAKKPGLFSGGAIAGIPVTYPAIWAAIYAVASILPAIPLVGGGTFGGQEFIVTLAGILFGTIGGAWFGVDQALAWVSGVVCQFRIVGSVHSSLFAPINSLRTPNKSGLCPEVNDWLGLAQSST